MLQLELINLPAPRSPWWPSLRSSSMTGTLWANYIRREMKKRENGEWRMELLVGIWSWADIPAQWPGQSLVFLRQFLRKTSFRHSADHWIRPWDAHFVAARQYFSMYIISLTVVLLSPRHRACVYLRTRELHLPPLIVEHSFQLTVA